MILTGQDKLNEALHKNPCGDKWALRVQDDCAQEKLDDLIVAVSGSSSVNQSIYNITIANANVEQSLVMPVNIIGYMIKSRDRELIKLSHVSGASGTNYLTIKPGAVYTDDHKYTNLTIYFQSPSAGAVVELVVWY